MVSHCLTIQKLDWLSNGPPAWTGFQMVRQPGLFNIIEKGFFTLFMSKMV
jgi:hypothetical protein